MGPASLAVIRFALTKRPAFPAPLFSSIRGFGTTTSIIKKRKPVRKVLVVGAGAIGLRTATELIRRNVDVVLHAPQHPLHLSTCSMGAGGLWMPYHVEDERIERWAKETLSELLQYRNTGFVEIVPAVYLKRGLKVPDTVTDHLVEDLEEIMLPGWSNDERIDFHNVYIKHLSYQNIDEKMRIPPEEELLEAGYDKAWFFRPPVVDAPKMLEHLLSKVKKKAEVNVETNEYFESVEQMQEKAAQLGCDTVVNCTGLGAGSICNDDQVVSARGILLQFDRANCVRRRIVREPNPGHFGYNMYDTIIMAEEEPWGSETMPCYLIPRGETIVVGGSYLEGDTEASIRDDERERLFVNADRLGIDVKHSKLIGEWVGFRPFRKTVRCELDSNIDDDNVQVFHSYGYGGSGWTVNVGAARECADILVGKKPMKKRLPFKKRGNISTTRPY